jgi:hypothetical protein
MGCRECVVVLREMGIGVAGIYYRHILRATWHIQSRKIIGLALLMNKNKIDSTRFKRQLPCSTAVPLKLRILQEFAIQSNVFKP